MTCRDMYGPNANCYVFGFQARVTGKGQEGWEKEVNDFIEIMPDKLLIYKLGYITAQIRKRRRIKATLADTDMHDSLFHDASSMSDADLLYWKKQLKKKFKI